MKSFRTLLCVLAVASLFVVNASASDRVSKYVSDSMIKTIVERNLAKLLNGKDVNVQVTVDDRVVTLTGTVPSLKSVRDVEKQAWKAKNDVRVENRLTVYASNRSDEQIAQEVSSTIRRYPFYDIFDWVEGKVIDGALTLTGSVRQSWRKSDYEKILESVIGVKRIDNELRPLPLSTFDDEIRAKAAAAIYREPTLRKYAHEANPPIHVIVENGKLRLEGIVATPMERQIAENAVRTQIMAFEVMNALRVEQTGNSTSTHAMSTLDQSRR